MSFRASWLSLAVVAACDSPSAEPDATISPDVAKQPTALPAKLSQTGFFDGNKRSFAPRNILWSDGAAKERWIVIPDGASIDTSNFDRWIFPVGTKWFKTFSLENKKLETRVIWRVADTGDRERDTLFGAYLWDDAESDATFAVDGGENLRGTQHDAPSAATCWRCHIGEPGRALGFSAVQLPPAMLAELPLSNPPPPETIGAPNAALGYLHANCGHCHNPEGGAWTNSSMVLRLGAGEHDAATTQIVATTVGVPLTSWLGHGYTDRVVAGDPDTSAIIARISQRAPQMQMPPIATEFVDDTGVALLRTWIEGL